MVTRSEVIQAARSYLGTPFHHQGRLKGVGVDCAGLLVCACRDAGLEIIDSSNYTRHPDGVMLRQTCDANLTEIPFAEVQPGDVMLFKFAQEPQHVALVGDYVHGGLSIIHGYSPSKMVIETRLDSKWISRIVACYKLKDAE